MSDDGLICPMCSRALSAAAPVCPNEHGVVVRGVRQSEVERTPRSKRHLLGLTISDTYVINGYLGSGGFGAVYRAEQTTVGRDVALKLLMADAVNDPAVIHRFRREARTAAALLDPNVVTLFDFGEARLSDDEEDHALWIAMELVNGPTLKAVLREHGGLGLEGAIFTGLNILRGLAAAHQLGVVHRDLKPGNVLIDQSKRRPYFARLFDFGIASLQGSSGHTMTVGGGGVLGTPKYMAPEQWRAKRTTPATDVYAFGVMLAEMLLGHPPIPKMELVKMAAAHCRGPRPRIEWTSHHEPVPEALIAHIETCMAIEPEDRFPSAREALDALEEIARGFDARGLPSDAGRVSGALAWPGDSSGSLRFDLEAPPPPSVDNEGVIDPLNPGSLDVFDPDSADDSPRSDSLPPAWGAVSTPSADLPPARSGEIPPPLMDDDTVVVDDSVPEDLAMEASALLPPPVAPAGALPGAPPNDRVSSIPPPFGSLSGSLSGPRSLGAGLRAARPLERRSLAGGSLSGRRSLDVRGSLDRPGPSGAYESAESVSLPPMVDFDSVPPDEPPPEPPDPGASGERYARAGPTDRAPAPTPAVERRLDARGPATDESVAPIPGARPASAPPAEVADRRTMRDPALEAVDAPARAPRPAWHWLAIGAAAVALLIAVRSGLEGAGDPRPGIEAEGPATADAVGDPARGAEAINASAGGATPVAPTPAPAVEASPQPVAPVAPEPVEPAPAPVEPAPVEPKPVEKARPVEPKPEPVEPRPEPVEPRPKPVEPRPKPVEPKPKPVEPEPVEPKPKPVEPKPKPVEPKPKPVEPKPVEPRPKPVEPQPVERRPQPVEPQPVAPTPVAPPPALNAAAEADYLRGLDAMRRGAYSSAQSLFTKALAAGLGGPQAADARRRIAEIADAAALEADF